MAVAPTDVAGNGQPWTIAWDTSTPVCQVWFKPRQPRRAGNCPELMLQFARSIRADRDLPGKIR